MPVRVRPVVPYCIGMLTMFKLKSKPVLKDGWDTIELTFCTSIHRGSLDTLLDSIKKEMLNLSGAKYTEDELSLLSYADVIMRESGDFYGDYLYSDYIVKFRLPQSTIDSILENHQKKMDEYQQWYDENKSEIEAELKRRKQIAEDKKLKKQLQSEQKK